MSEFKNNYLELALKTAGVAYWEWNPKENILEFDKEWFQQIEVLGDDTRLESWMKALHPDDHEKVAFKIKEHLEGKSDFYEVIMRLKTKKGYYRHVLAKGKIVEYNDNKEPIKFSGVHIDLTEMISLKQENQEYEKELQQLSASTALNELSSGIAHEINNPLTIILANADVMEKPNLDERQIKSLETIKKAAKRISNVVIGLRDFSSLNNFNQQPLNLSQIFESLTLKYFQELDSKNIEFSIENKLSSPNLEVFCQRDKICKVFNNLVKNSLEAIANLEKKWIKIIAEQENDFLKISIIDSGKIISKEIENKMFHPFFTSKEVGQNMGLGLTTCRGILESHGGKIKYNDKKDNTCFEVFLPIKNRSK